MKFGAWFVLFFSVLAVCANAGSQAGADQDPAPLSQAPVHRWECEIQAGALWDFGSRHETPLDYVFVPGFISLTSPEHGSLNIAGGELFMRARFSVTGQAITEGPESYFLGVRLSPVFEWWRPGAKLGVYGSLGGGFGWLDSAGAEVEGGQGQDFNLHYFGEAGLRYRLSERITLNASAYFQHISNGGMNDINPGVDALGPMLGVSIGF